MERRINKYFFEDINEVMGLKSRERRNRSLRSELEGKENMVVLVNMLVGGLEVPLRAFCWKARGGGGRLRHATMVGILFIIHRSYIL